jgi:glycosyltransferase involved in cell wall biosynthesis
MKPQYSVVVPTYNESETIERCVKSLLDQTMPPESYEVLVVDDGSTDDTARIVKRYPVRYYFQANQGAASARNLGAAHARGDIVLFTDADCEVSRNWIEEMVKPFSDMEIAGVKGFYRTSQKKLMARLVQKEYESKYRYLLKSKYIDFVDTYSAAYRKEIFLKSGGFDTQFRTASAEDCDLSYLLSSQGYKMVASARAVVSHMHPDSLKRYLKTKFRNASWRVLAYRKNRQKILKDSHTPVVLKLQMLLLFVILVLSGLHLFTRIPVALTLTAAALFISSTIPFAFRNISSDWQVAVFSPLLAILRTTAYLCGLGAGVLLILTQPDYEGLGLMQVLRSKTGGVWLSGNSESTEPRIGCSSESMKGQR